MPKLSDIRLVFQQRLRNERLQRQLSLRDLGEKTGLDTGVAGIRINRYEQGVHEPDMAMIERLAAALHVPAAYLFADDEQLARLIVAFDRLDDGDKKRVLSVIEYQPGSLP